MEIVKNRFQESCNISVINKINIKSRPNHRHIIHVIFTMTKGVDSPRFTIFTDKDQLEAKIRVHFKIRNHQISKNRIFIVAKNADKTEPARGHGLSERETFPEPLPRLAASISRCSHEVARALTMHARARNLYRTISMI